MKRMILSLVVMLMVIGQIQSVGATGNQYIAIKEIASGVVMPVSGAVNATVTGSVNAVQSGTWVIATVTAIANTVTISNLSETKDGVKVYGNNSGTQVQLAVDSAGKVLTSSGVSGTALEKVVTLTNIATGSYVELGSFTVTTGKTAYIYDVTFTGGNVKYKVSDGTASKDIYGETSAGSPMGRYATGSPAGKAAGTIVRIYAWASDTVNEGTARINYSEQ